MTKLSGRDETIAVLVKDFKGLLDLLFAVDVAELAGHEADELAGAQRE